MCICHGLFISGCVNACMHARTDLYVGGEVVGGEAAAAEVDDLDLHAGVGLDDDVLRLLCLGLCVGYVCGLVCLVEGWGWFQNPNTIAFWM